MHSRFKRDGTYLSRSGLRQVGCNIDLLGSSERTNDLADLERKFLDQASLVIRIVFEFAEKAQGRPSAGGRGF